MPDPDLFAVRLGSVTAPAGCGKTHLIANSLMRHSAPKPVLVLTHTNAGVAALRARLDTFGVPRTAYRLSTLDGWAMRLIGYFPTRSGHPEATLELRDRGRDYPAIREGALSVLQGGHVRDILAASYDRLLVDEYQDCLIEQHAMVREVAETLPTCVLGDPMQAIFGWGNNVLVDWAQDVQATYPDVGSLSTPWRWNNVQCGPFGNWLLGVREALLVGQPIDLRSAPENVKWVQCNGVGDMDARLRAAQTAAPIDGGSALIVCDSRKPRRHHDIAKRTHGAVVVENVDLTDFVDFAQTFDFRGPQATENLISFAARIMTGVGAPQMHARLASLRAGRARNEASDAERAALEFMNNRDPASAVELLVEINKQAGVRSHRPALLRACIQSLNTCSDVEEFYDRAVSAREQARLLGRPLPRRAVGSTLLLKGLEADLAVILDTEALDAKNLYVAMTRGSRGLVVCSTSPLVSPAR